MMLRKYLFILLCMLPLLVGAREYVGTLHVGESLTLENVRVEVLENNSNQVTLRLHRVKFSRWMPVRLDIDIPNVQEKNGVLSLQHTIPLMDGKPYEKKHAKNLHGRVSTSALSFSLILGQSEVKFEGK